MLSILSITAQRYIFSVKYLVNNLKKVVKNFFKTYQQLILSSQMNNRWTFSTMLSTFINSYQQ